MFNTIPRENSKSVTQEIAENKEKIAPDSAIPERISQNNEMSELTKQHLADATARLTQNGHGRATPTQERITARYSTPIKRGPTSRLTREPGRHTTRKTNGTS